MADKRETVTVDLVAIATRGDVHDALQELASKACKADLTALEHAFRAGWAARDIACPSINAVLLTPSAAWNEFLAGELKAFEI